MDLNILENIIRIAEQSELSVLEVECDGLRVRMEKPAISVKSAYTYTPEPRAPQAQAQSAPEPVVAAEPIPAGCKELRSPMVGTFHFAKGKESLIGKALKKGETACVIEAMKLMNEIAMEEDGEIAWIAVEEGEMVEYGQLLFTFN